MTKAERIISITLAGILLLTIINSAWFFLGIAKVSIIQWIVFNACAPSGIAFILGLLIYYKTSDRAWLSVAIVPMMFFGTMGLFVFPWNSGMDILVQFSHMIMTLNIAWGLYVILKNKDIRALGYGLLASIIVFIPFIAFTQAYCREHAEEVMKYLNL
ncbi:MAG: hypothetical protein LBV72_09640 [Tannerella sp.]|jgi:hypothetical protein|nr:hypothetical protein [Tannerella sp.]